MSRQQTPSSADFRVVIPARYGSTRLPGKPLIEINGRPLLAWVWESACASAAAEVLIATDDARIADAASSFGAQVMMTRSDHLSGSERISEVAESKGWGADEILVNLQGDEPGMAPELIDQVAEGLASHPEAGVSTLACRIASAETLFDPNVVKVVRDRLGAALYFSRAPIPWHRDAFRQAPTGELPPLPAQGDFLRHIGLYAYRAGFLRRYITWPSAPTEQTESLEQLRVLWQGERIHVSIAVALPGPGVDTPEDLVKVRRWLDSR